MEVTVRLSSAWNLIIKDQGNMMQFLRHLRQGTTIMPWCNMFCLKVSIKCYTACFTETSMISMSPTHINVHQTQNRLCVFKSVLFSLSCLVHFLFQLTSWRLGYYVSLWKKIHDQLLIVHLTTWKVSCWQHRIIMCFCTFRLGSCSHSHETVRKLTLSFPE